MSLEGGDENVSVTMWLLKRDDEKWFGDRYFAFLMALVYSEILMDVRMLGRLMYTSPHEQGTSWTPDFWAGRPETFVQSRNHLSEWHPALGSPETGIKTSCVTSYLKHGVADNFSSCFTNHLVVPCWLLSRSSIHLITTSHSPHWLMRYFFKSCRSSYQLLALKKAT